MATSFLEIIATSDGDIALQRTGDDGEPLVVIKFSDEAKRYLMDNMPEVGRAMIQAGIEAAAQLSEQGDLDGAAEYGNKSARLLH